MFITGEEALGLARDEIETTGIRRDPLFAPWDEGSLGRPFLVRDVFGNPSYWLVPVVIRNRVAGFVTVLGAGKVADIGTYYRDPKGINACPATVTGIEAEEALRRAEARIEAGAGETASAPRYVHDGPVGREAWQIEVSKGGKPSRWIFVTPAFIYERPAGELLDETLE